MMVFLYRKEERIQSLEDEIKQKITQFKRWGETSAKENARAHQINISYNNCSSYNNYTIGQLLLAGLLGCLVLPQCFA